MLDASNPSEAKAKKNKPNSQQRPVQRFWPESIANLQPKSEEGSEDGMEKLVIRIFRLILIIKLNNVDARTVCRVGDVYEAVGLHVFSPSSLLLFWCVPIFFRKDIQCVALINKMF